MPVYLNELLGRPLIKIYQDSDSFCFSLDSILLASFATITRNCKKVVDLCSGNAPIPLYLSLRTQAEITGIEIQEKIYKLAIASVKLNSLENRINILNDDIVGISQKLGKHVYDLVTVNPPFFKVGTSNVNEIEEKAIARHEIKATLDDVIKEASELLNSKGYFSMVHRPDRLIEIIDVLRKYKIEPKRLRLVYPKIGSQAGHILIEGIKDGQAGSLKILEPLFVYDTDGGWSKEIRKIYNFEED